MHEIRLVNRKICQKWKVELITKATPINYRKRHSQFEKENYCKQQNWLIESLNEGIFPEKRCKSWLKMMSFDTHDDSFYVTKFHAIPLFGPMILQVLFFIFWTSCLGTFDSLVLQEKFLLSVLHQGSIKNLISEI